MVFFKNWFILISGHNSRIFSQNQLKISTQHKDINHQSVSENVIKIGGDFGAIFRKKAWAIAFAFFQKLAYFKNSHNSRNICQNQLKLST